MYRTEGNKMGCTHTIIIIFFTIMIKLIDFACVRYHWKSTPGHFAWASYHRWCQLFWGCNSNLLATLQLYVQLFHVLHWATTKRSMGKILLLPEALELCCFFTTVYIFLLLFQLTTIPVSLLFQLIYSFLLYIAKLKIAIQVSLSHKIAKTCPECWHIFWAFIFQRPFWFKKCHTRQLKENTSKCVSTHLQSIQKLAVLG